MDEIDGAVFAATRTAEFWRCYAFDEFNGFSFEKASERLARRLHGIETPDEDDEDDEYEDEDDEDEDEDEDDDEDLYVRVILPARRGWWLRIGMDFDLTLFSLALQRDDEEDGEYDEDEYEVAPATSLELGHWDQARWHPFCLRWSELEAVVAQMRAAPDRHPLPPDMALLLLARWVGHGSDESALLDARREGIAATLERLGLFQGDDAVRMAANLLRAVPDEDYAWRWDGERGWTFGGEYPHYSKRNDSHSGFPFAQFAEFRRELAVADRD